MPDTSRESLLIRNSSHPVNTNTMHTHSKRVSSLFMRLSSQNHLWAALQSPHHLGNYITSIRPAQTNSVALHKNAGPESRAGASQKYIYCCCFKNVSTMRAASCGSKR